MINDSVALVPLNGPVPLLLSVAVTLKLKVPPAAGVPERIPALDKLTPAGSEPDASA